MNTLYDQRFEHDACGIGAVIDIGGKQSHQVVDDALTIVEKLQHRAGMDATGEIGDGVGIMVQISHKFFKKVAKELSIDIGGERDYGIGMFFFPEDSKARRQAMRLFEVICQKEGVEFLAWREVPINEACLSEKAKESMPELSMMFLYAHPEKLDMVKEKLSPVLGETKLIVASEQMIDKVSTKFLTAIGR